jgi:hypothetical protein
MDEFIEGFKKGWRETTWRAYFFPIRWLWAALLGQPLPNGPLSRD